jgi:hypothetical protein
MKRLILWLVLGAGFIHGFNMLAPSSRDWGSRDSQSKKEADTQSIETQSIENKRVDSWGAYLPHVPRASTERQHQEGQQIRSGPQPDAVAKNEVTPQVSTRKEQQSEDPKLSASRPAITTTQERQARLESSASRAGNTPPLPSQRPRTLDRSTKAPQAAERHARIPSWSHREVRTRPLGMFILGESGFDPKR